MTAPRPSRWISVGLWVFAFAGLVVIAGYQRRTGPTWPVSGVSDVPGGGEIAWSLPRSETTGTAARIEIPDPGPGVEATLAWRRYPTEDAFTVIPMEPIDGRRAAQLPTQPPAGKVEYRVELAAPGGLAVSLPSGEAVVLRYKGAVPAAVLVPHVLAMFLGLVVGMRTVLQAARGGWGLKPLAWTTVALLVLGGLVLGPIVQKYAFGAFWTGWPAGADLTDNKVAVMVLGWLAAALSLGRPSVAGRGRRFFVLIAGAVTLVVYLVPHSLRGSTLDYDRVDRGEDPSRAVGTGR